MRSISFEDMDAIVCQLCREPIWNFLCVDCLGKNVEQWLPRGFSHEFTKFHSEIKSHFHTYTADNYEPCLDCNKLSETPICPYCYTHEIYHWMSGINSDMAAKFSKIFFFYPFEGSEHIKSETGPIEETRKKSKESLGMCDNCGEYSDALAMSNGGWYCEICSEE